MCPLLSTPGSASSRPLPPCVRCTLKRWTEKSLARPNPWGRSCGALVLPPVLNGCSMLFNNQRVRHALSPADRHRMRPSTVRLIRGQGRSWDPQKHTQIEAPNLHPWQTSGAPFGLLLSTSQTDFWECSVGPGVGNQLVVGGGMESRFFLTLCELAACRNLAAT